MKISANLPNEVKSITYVKNHHFIELEDHEGNRTKLAASGILIGKCQKCDATCVALSRIGDLKCTHCGGEVKWAWNRPQLAFIPESESGFMGADEWRNSLKKTPNNEGLISGVDLIIPLPKTES